MALEFTSKDLEAAELSLQITNSFGFSYWRKRIDDRIKYLIPLVNEMAKKGMYLKDVCNELNNEWNYLHSLRRRYMEAELLNYKY